MAISWWYDLMDLEPLPRHFVWADPVLTHQEITNGSFLSQNINQCSTIFPRILLSTESFGLIYPVFMS
jgi:hypothetical protein